MDLLCFVLGTKMFCQVTGLILNSNASLCKGFIHI